ncbi:hypothetical protein [uncultured Dokdonia sp.]|uniref:hypothetical protein n=1 Tax=uncultured Dokdonia sp. TaxID=575653 RepID=UPI0026099C18|nr:hypothetical protein [uncultured Dokdonia sp.]
MKKIILVAAFLMLSIFQGFSQDRDFDGLWEGVLEKENGEQYKLTLFIEDNNVYGVTTDEDDDLVKDRQFEVQISKGYGEHLNFFWINKGGVWTETQMFSLSWSSDSELSVFHTRHVSNKSDEIDGNTDWGYFAKGTLK